VTARLIENILLCTLNVLEHNKLLSRLYTSSGTSGSDFSWLCSLVTVTFLYEEFTASANYNRVNTV